MARRGCTRSSRATNPRWWPPASPTSSTSASTTESSTLEIAHAGLLNAEQDPRGALYRVGHHGKKLIKHTSLVMPGGLALRGGNAYISNCSVCPADGS